MGIRTISYRARRDNGEAPSVAYPGAIEDARHYNQIARRRAFAGALLAAAALGVASASVRVIGHAMDQVSAPSQFPQGISPEPSMKEANAACAGESGIVAVREHKVNCDALPTEQRFAVDVPATASQMLTQ